MNYGCVSHAHICILAKAVCDALGNGANNNAHVLLIETCCAETQLGEYADPTPDSAGRGVSQIDSGTFYWLKEKAIELGDGACMRYKRSWVRKISENFGINIARVEHSELDYNPLLALIWARLRYLVIDEVIPNTREERARYWKLHYNTSAGDGDEQHYLTACNNLLEGLC